jgi:hypothetical protein
MTYTEEHARTLLFTAQRDAAQYLVDCAQRDIDEPTHAIERAARLGHDEVMPLTVLDYSGDHEDYNSAALGVLSAITNAVLENVWTEGSDAVMILTNLIADSDFLDDAEVCDFNTPLFDELPNRDDD